jgi:SAM-dependent methyltransferase
VSNPARDESSHPEGLSDNARAYKREFWSVENLKFSEPWYRLEKSAKLITALAQGRRWTLLDVGCGPAALSHVLPENVEYYGIDMAIQTPAPNLIECDFLESPIAFNAMRFDIVVANGVFEYMGDFELTKLAEISRLLEPNGKFVATYTNFGHRRPVIYPAFSNVKPLEGFREDLSRYFTVDRVFPASHNWKHSQPSRRLVRAVNMHVSANIPVVSPKLAVEYFFVCSPRMAES